MPPASPPGAARPRNSLRVALLAERLSRYGGTEGFTWRLAEALAGAGHHVDVICSRQEDEAPRGVGVVAVGRPPLFRSAKLIWYALAAERTRRKGAYDVTVSLANTLAQDLCRVSGGPLPLFQKMTIRAYPAGLSRLVKRIRRALAPANAVATILQNKRYRSGAKIVAVSHKVRDWLVRVHDHLDPAAVEVIYNKPDTERFRPPGEKERQAARTAYSLSPEQIAVSLAGTNFNLKGVETAIRALALLPPRYRLLVAGGRRPGRFAGLARRLGVAERVDFLGKVKDMVRLYHASDLFILPTFYDACSNAVLEARACGLKAISTASNGASHFLPDRWILKDAADHETLARLVLAAGKEPPSIPFVWPPDVQSGIQPYVEMIERGQFSANDRPSG